MAVILGAMQPKHAAVFVISSDFILGIFVLPCAVIFCYMFEPVASTLVLAEAHEKRR